MSETSYTYTPLPEPISIIEQSWPEGTSPLVHTRTMTYNHEKYIRECIEGILMQKTTFPVQVLIHDDASTDKTVEIVREYEEMYPRLIKVYYQKENTRRHPERPFKRKPFYDLITGKYIALCEGDDYWTDPLKLQRQIDFLERNKDFTFCTHDWLKIYEHINTKPIKALESYPHLTAKKIAGEDAYRIQLSDYCKYLVGGHTATVVHRSNLLDKRYPFQLKMQSGDWVRDIKLLEMGDGAFLPYCMSVLRKNPGGITQQKRTGLANFNLVSYQYYSLAMYVKGWNKRYFYFRLCKVYIKMLIGHGKYRMSVSNRLAKIHLFFIQSYHILFKT